MGKKKDILYQLAFAFDAHADHIVLTLGQVASQRQSERLFGNLLIKEWLLEPAGEAADVSSAQDLIKQLNRKLPYPQSVKVAQLHNVEPDFMGFSALYQTQGWVFVNAHASEYERFYQTCVLVASLGLYQNYKQTSVLAARAELLVFEAFLPEDEVHTFFHKSIVKFSSTLAADIADFFKLPFAVVLKRALQLDIITDSQYRKFMTVKPHYPKKAKPLFVSHSGALDGDLDPAIWGNDL